MPKIEINTEIYMMKTKSVGYRRHIGSMMTISDIPWSDENVEKWNKEEFQPIVHQFMNSIAQFMKSGHLPDKNQIINTFIMEVENVN